MCSTACYSYLPAFKQFGSNVKIVHFIAQTKPWLQIFDPETRQVRPSPDLVHLTSLLQRWWNIFCSAIHPQLSTEMAPSKQPSAHSSLSHYSSPKQFQNTNEPTQQVVWDPWEEYDKKQLEETINIDNSQNISIQNHDLNVENYSENNNQSWDNFQHYNLATEQNNLENKIAECNPSESITISFNIGPNSSREPSHSFPVEYCSEEINVSTNETVYTSISNNESEYLNFPSIPTYDNNEINISHSNNSCIESNNRNSNNFDENVSPNIDKVVVPIPQPNTYSNTSISSECVANEFERPFCEAASSVTKENAIHPSGAGETVEGGFAGAFARLTLGEPRSAEQSALEDQLRRQGWEIGNIDYMNRDAFGNIWNKICETLAGAPNASNDDNSAKQSRNELEKKETEKSNEGLVQGEDKFISEQSLQRTLQTPVSETKMLDEVAKEKLTEDIISSSLEVADKQTTEILESLKVESVGKQETSPESSPLILLSEKIVEVPVKTVETEVMVEEKVVGGEDKKNETTEAKVEEKRVGNETKVEEKKIENEPKVEQKKIESEPKEEKENENESKLEVNKFESKPKVEEIKTETEPKVHDKEPKVEEKVIELKEVKTIESEQKLEVKMAKPEPNEAEKNIEVEQKTEVKMVSPVTVQPEKSEILEQSNLTSTEIKTEEPVLTEPTKANVSTVSTNSAELDSKLASSEHLQLLNESKVVSLSTPEINMQSDTKKNETNSQTQQSEQAGQTAPEVVQTHMEGSLEKSQSSNIQQEISKPESVIPAETEKTVETETKQIVLEKEPEPATQATQSPSQGTAENVESKKTKETKPQKDKGSGKKSSKTKK
ncbi:putative uncharacterized protein DDB_G0282133 isoform X1 [Agrilus planipennis]|uniref:Uncharacterized protein n=1 Tax=Agrilus planipennis TaxID=224129 RepID=A0A1W4X141_AGRPL|nr:putative uncharacterized protein DDB_G0282133 isoform X1 [Agrilus planipennis]